MSCHALLLATASAVSVLASATNSAPDTPYARSGFTNALPTPPAQLFAWGSLPTGVTYRFTCWSFTSGVSGIVSTSDIRHAERWRQVFSELKSAGRGILTVQREYVELGRMSVLSTYELKDGLVDGKERHWTSNATAGSSYEEYDVVAGFRKGRQIHIRPTRTNSLYHVTEEAIDVTEACQKLIHDSPELNDNPNAAFHICR